MLVGQVIYESFSYHIYMRNDCLQIIGKRIHELRTEKGLSQMNLGEMLSVSQDTISLWEKSKSYPPVEMIILLSKIFEVSSDYLLGLIDY